MICAYAEQCGPILPQLSRRSTNALNTLLIKIFESREHELLFTAALAAYGAYGLARDAASAAACFESGVFGAVRGYFVRRYGGGAGTPPENDKSQGAQNVTFET